MSLLVLVVTLNGRSRGFVDPHLLNLHLRRERMNLEAFAHEIWIFRLFSSDLSAQLKVVVQLQVMRDSSLTVKSSSDTSSDSGLTIG